MVNNTWKLVLIIIQNFTVQVLLIALSKPAMEFPGSVWLLLEYGYVTRLYGLHRWALVRVRNARRIWSSKLWPPGVVQILRWN